MDERAGELGDRCEQQIGADRGLELMKSATSGTLLAANERRLALPILGVPGWFADSEAPACYGDVDVFRPRRTDTVARRVPVGDGR